VAGPRNSLERNYYYFIGKDLKFIAERAKNANVGSVNLFMRHNKPWMNRKVRSANLWLDQALMGYYMFQTGVIDTASYYERLHITWLTSKFQSQEKTCESYC
jgi:hypothetical protein